jgi:23S rRNA pseudoU1915 N3-methylase RlmH
MYNNIDLLHITKMEKRLNKRIETYITTFKNDIRDKIIGIDIEQKNKNEMIEFVYEYERLVFSKDDLVKRKRVKNSIPCTNRCNARRANNEQCTRRRKDGSEYCGTHSKGIPNGFMKENEVTSNSTQKIDISTEEIQGIVYYIDKFNNVYKTDDIIANKPDPQIIAKYVKTPSGYSIPEFGI